MKEIKITDISGFKIGHYTDRENATGVTVIINEKGAMAGGDVRGGGPASKESELLKPMAAAQFIHSICLSGGSAYGLDSTSGVMRFLEERGIGFDVGCGIVPLVVGASLFDLELVQGKVRPTAEYGYKACEAAFAGGDVAEGNVGAGTGAAIGKWRGVSDMMKAGLGIYAVQVGEVKMGAIVAVNALGDVVDPATGKTLAGLLKPDHKSLDSTVSAMIDSVETDTNLWSGNTTIGAIITNAKLTKDQCCKACGLAHNGYALAIRPVHSTADGDTIMMMSTCEVEVGFDAVGVLATQVMAEAIKRAALMSEPVYGLLSAQSFR